MADEQLSLDLRPFEPDQDGDVHFERLAKENGTRYWFARDLMVALGYENWISFKKGPINKAIGVCTTLSIPVTENFIQRDREIDGKRVEDLQLTRFACCLVSLNGDSKNPRVAAAQAYFASLALLIQDA